VDCSSDIFLYYFFERLFCFAVNLVLFHWQAEVNYLGQLHHENLVKLIGYCSESDNRLLVYEYMPKGSLENHLFRSKCIFFKGPAFFDFCTSPLENCAYDNTVGLEKSQRTNVKEGSVNCAPSFSSFKGLFHLIC